MLPENALFAEIRELILNARKNADVAVDAVRVELYWDVGFVIRNEIIKSDRAAYGKRIIKNLSQLLSNEFGRGYSQPQLWFFVQFVAEFPDKEILYAVRREFNWTYFKIFISLKDNLERQFYMEMCKLERWSTRQLRERIDSALYLRTAISKKPEYTIKNEIAKKDRIKNK